ncbi:lipopolysaccharide biosynthesis protein [Brasilonema octagenarum UFV-E1]|uniref:Lipopolysaccharide biosynthesis protein n=1 Tax=Brasilonema sennae CENA114 TaxID=415709 RepID=A0A856MEX5_9CYAN|nr:lipopolysaccharide biosynthesis protein [Brasilonema sennae]QDL08864.1 lipopolysaccharide biosynthesis protein [Brasilonema sennae CENA114]QDL15221.1 lipopolysaccharide biosynthesis protein [Brasilonema octagenarum UFV-E1]
MRSIHPVINIIKKKFSGQFIRNVGWLSISEIIYRVLRLGLVVIIARYLNRHDYGLGAIIMTVREFSLTFADIGISAKIIQAEEEELEDLCNSAYWLSWVVFFSLFVIQSIAAFPIAWFYKSPNLILPIIVSGIAYLIWPLSTIQKTLIQRENRLKVIAIANSAQNFTGSILTAIFAVLGMGVWSLVLPSILISPLEPLIYYRAQSWRVNTGFTTKSWSQIFKFGKNILGVSLLRTLRNNLDYLLVGRFVVKQGVPEYGIQELGLYFFGFNAGLGISLSIINAINSAILPHLCAVRSELSELKKSYFSSLKTIRATIIPFVILQSSLAHIYVPIVFGKKWVPAIPIVILICLSAIPRPFADAASQLLIAVGKPHLDLYWNIIFTFLFSITILIGVNLQFLGVDTSVLSVHLGEHWQIIVVAISVLLVHIVFLPLFTLWATNYVFPKTKKI